MPRKLPRITAPDAKLVKLIAAGKSVKDAAVESGISEGRPETARVKAYQRMARPEVKAALEKALDKNGAKIEDSARVIGEAHSANKLVGIGFKVHEMPDHKIRLEAARDANRLRGLIGSDDEGAGGSGNVFNIVAIIKQAAAERGLPL